jgi:hypothetical protein
MRWRCSLKESGAFTGSISSPALAFCQRNQNIEIIMRGGLVAFFQTAARAAVDDAINATFDLHPDRFHQTLTGGIAVTGVDVDMLAPQAVRAVIGITAAGDLLTAVFAHKIFNSTLEFSTHKFIKHEYHQLGE